MKLNYILLEKLTMQLLIIFFISSIIIFFICIGYSIFNPPKEIKVSCYDKYGSKIDGLTCTGSGPNGVIIMLVTVVIILFFLSLILFLLHIHFYDMRINEEFEEDVAIMLNGERNK